MDSNDEVIRPTTTTHPTRLNFSFPFLSSPCGERKKNKTNNDEPKQNEKDPNAMAVGPPANDITAPPISGGIGMIPTGLMRSSSGAGGGGGGMISVGGGEGGESEQQRFDAGGYETTFSMGGAPSSSSSSSSPEGGGGKGGGWWPFGGSSS